MSSRSPKSSQFANKTRLFSKNFRCQRYPFLRSIGLELPFILNFHKDDGEPMKCVIKRSRRLALERCAVHIIPVMVSCALIYLNLAHSYLGRTIPGSIIDPSVNIALLQFAAKVQELLIVASAGTVAIEVIRHELISGEGVPLGMLVGGFSCINLSYFWSPELFGALRASCSRASRLQVFAVLVLVGMIASLAGPASAVLLIPKEQSWTAGGSDIFFPISADQMWPSQLSVASEVESLCADALLQHGLCRAGGHLSLFNARDAFEIFRSPAYVRGTPHNITTNLIFGTRSVDLANNFKLSPGMRYSGNFRSYACETAVVGARTLESIYHMSILKDWRSEAMSVPWTKGKASSQYKYYRSLTATSGSRIPAVRVSCTPAQNVTHVHTQVAFPILDPNGCSATPSNTRSVSVDSLANVSSSRVQIIWRRPKDADGLGPISSTVIVQLPSAEVADSRSVIGCSIDARWADGNLVTSDLRSFLTSSNLDVNFHAQASLGPVIHLSPTGMGSPEYSEFRPIILNPTSTRILLYEDWLYPNNALMNTTKSESSGWGSSSLQRFFENVSALKGLSTAMRTPTEAWNEDRLGEVNRTVALEWTFALLVADALSRTGSEHLLNTSGPASSWSIHGYTKVPAMQKELFRNGNAFERPNTSNPWTQEHVDITIGGYSYRASSITDYLSILLLAMHILIALSHTTFMVLKGTSSNAWDSISELLVLAQNSRPAPLALKNATPGIKRLQTYSEVARVYAVPPCSCQKSEGINNVELIFDKDKPHDYPWRNKEEHRGAPPSNTTLLSSSESVRGENADRARKPIELFRCRICTDRNARADNYRKTELLDVKPDERYGHPEHHPRKRISFDRITM